MSRLKVDVQASRMQYQERAGQLMCKNYEDEVA